MTSAVELNPGLTRRCRTTAIGFIVASLVLGIVLARGGVWIQEAGFAPIILFRILVGAITGAIVYLLATQLTVGTRRTQLVAAACGAIACVLFEHVFFYLDYRADFTAATQKNPISALFQSSGDLQPAGFLDFIVAGAGRGGFPGWAQWLLDAILTIVAAMAVVWFIERQRATPAGQSDTGI